MVPVGDLRVERVSFERARLDYCRRVFEREEERREGLERKAQFYLSFLTLVLAAIFIKPDYLTVIREAVAGGPGPAAAGILIASTAALGLSLLFGVFTIMAAVRVRKYRGEYPGDLTDALFAPDSPLLADKTEAHMICVTGMNYAVAVETNRAVNDRKGAWLRLTAVAAQVTALSLTILLAAMTILAFAR